MKFIINIQKISIYLLIFSLNFETLNLFNLDINYLASKITVSFLILVSMFNYKLFLPQNLSSKYLYPIILYFALLTFINFVNRNSSSEVFFDFAFFLNLIIFTILTNCTQKQPDTLLKGLFVFAISTFILSILSIVGVGATDAVVGLEGRATVFGMNQNMLGVSACVSLLVLASIVIDNRFIRGKSRFLILLMIPFLFILMINTGSRLAFISLISGISVFVYFKNLKISAKKIILLTILFISFIALWQLYLKNVLLSERLFSSIKEGDLSSRDLIWLTIFDIISNNYIWGVGKTGYAKEMGFYIYETIGSPHNVFIEVICYTGIVGLSIFLVFLYRIVKNAFSRRCYQNELLPIVILFPILGILLSGQIFDQKIVWVLFAYIAGSSAANYSARKA